MSTYEKNNKKIFIEIFCEKMKVRKHGNIKSIKNSCCIRCITKKKDFRLLETENNLSTELKVKPP